MDTLSSFLSSMLALSIGVERVIEILKNAKVGLGFPGAPAGTALPVGAEARHNLLTHLASTGVGTIIALGVGPEQFVHGWSLDHTAGGAKLGASVLIGLMGSGGSAMWNHALDILGAVKAVKETTARQQLTTPVVASASGSPP